MSTPVIDLPLDEISAICRAHNVAELSLFGSALREDFRPDSDLDFLVTFIDHASASLFDLADLQHDLSMLFAREVDVVSRPGVERSANWIRRQAILSEATPVYVAR